MTLPVSSYEALLLQVRELTHETILLQRQLSSELCHNVDYTDVNHNLTDYQKNYEQGRLVIDNAIRRCDRKIDIGQRTLVDRNEFVFHPGLTPSLECPRENFNSGELTARLIAWRDQNRHRRPSYEEEKITRRSKNLETHRSNATTGIPGVRRFGIEASGTIITTTTTTTTSSSSSSSSLLLLLPWEASSTAVAAGVTGDGSLRPYYAAGDPPLSGPREPRRTTGEQPQSAARLSLPNTVTPAPRSSFSSFSSSSSSAAADHKRERCNNPRISYLNHDRRPWVEGHDMELNAKRDNDADSETPSPELYARTVKSYDEDGSSDDDDKPEDDSHVRRLSSLYHGTWPVKRDPWTNQQMSYSGPQTGSAAARHNDTSSVMSFSSSTATSGCSAGRQGHRRLGAKVDVVYSLLGMLGSSEGREDMSSTLLAMSNSIDSCLVMRQSGCLPLLIQLIHAPGQDSETRERAARALRNVVNARSDEKCGRREARVLRLLEQIRDYCQTLRTSLETDRPPDDLERHPGPTIAALMKLSFDEAHRHAMCQLGGLHAVAELIEMDHSAHGTDSEDQSCVTLRRYAGMALTNLTFGDGNNKALLCSFRAFMRSLVSQLRSASDDLRQVTASVLRNLSWRADSSSKQTLREVGAVTGLTRAAMEGRKESTLKSILSALWNLSAHCSTNKVDICAVEGALAFLVDMLSYEAPSKTLSIVENAGGILRNVSSHIAVRDDYRAIVRERDCLQVLLRQLRSPSLTVVSNSCGALWNLSARCPHDQRLLWDLGAVPMLRSLVHSKHKMISMGSSAALKNLLTSRPAGSNLVHLDSTARGLGLSALPSLAARRQRALEQEIDQNLSETCDNIEPSTSPVNKDEKFAFKVDQNFSDTTTRSTNDQQQQQQQLQQRGNQQTSSNGRYVGVARSDSRESMRSITSTHSDTIIERLNRRANNPMTISELQIKRQSTSLHSEILGSTIARANVDEKISNDRSEKSVNSIYKNFGPRQFSGIDDVTSNVGEELRFVDSTISWGTIDDREIGFSRVIMNSSNEEAAAVVDVDAGDVADVADVADVDSTSSTTTKIVNNDFTTTKKNSTIEKSSSTRLKMMNENFSTVEKISENIVDVETTNDRRNRSPVNGHESDDDRYEVYAETDIDRPTNYSLRYAERNSDEDDKQSSGYFAGSEHEIDDTTRIYCTEGTPYETPGNSSGTASDNDFGDCSGIRGIGRKIRLARINDDVERQTGTSDYRRKTFLTVERGLVKEDVAVGTSSSRVDEEKITVVGNGSEIDEDVAKSSESLADSGLAAGERSKSSGCDSETMKSSLEPNDSASIIDAAVTRLNCLVINDEPNIFDVSTPDKRSIVEITNENLTIDGENFPETMISDGDEDDEDLLAACIHIGMQNNRHRQSFRRNSLEKTPPEESNLARYQTSEALDQVEDPRFTDQTNDHQSQSENSIFNINSINDPTTLSNLQRCPSKNDCKIFANNLNVVQDDDKITVKYEKLREYSCVTNIDPIVDSIDGVNVTCESRKSVEPTSTSTRLQSRANSCEDNLSHDVDRIVVQSASSSTSIKNAMIRKSFETEKSIDSIERSEQTLLQLCIEKNSSEIKKNGFVDEDDDDEMFEVNDVNPTLTNDDEALDDSTIVAKTLENLKTSEKNLLRSSEMQTRQPEDEYRRQRDPDAMIASLDRLTATLVQQTEAMRERESTAMKLSVMSDTWNEDSPNDVSYPSISVSAPIISSFKSDVDDETTVAGTTSTTTRRDDDENVESTTMTNSIIIEREAFRLAEYVSAAGNRRSRNSKNDLQTASLEYVDLENVKPPSTMNSLVSLNSLSYSDNREDGIFTQQRCDSTSSPVRNAKTSLDKNFNARKKSLPFGVMAKRALAQTSACATSLDSLLYDRSLGNCSQLENVKPPSMMDEIWDNADMENSMISVASITSEIADAKDSNLEITMSDDVLDILKPVANVLSYGCMRYAETMKTSTSEYLENINPPSLLNEVSEMEDSTIDNNTETMCSDTLCIDGDIGIEEYTDNLDVKIINNDDDEAVGDEREDDDNDTDEGCAASMRTSESCCTSSCESTPKKRSNKNIPTPKEKRQLAKDRYRTYTIAGELTNNHDDDPKKRDFDENPKERDLNRAKCSPCAKLTPKQRRRDDRARFQTQVLENPFPCFVENVVETCESGNPKKITTTDDKMAAVEDASIVNYENFRGDRTFRKKRVVCNDVDDRYRTITLNDVDKFARENSLTSNNDVIATTAASDDMQTMLEKNANIVIHTLNETSKVVVDATLDETIIECETLSLVSNDSESEQSLLSRMRFANGLGKKLLTSNVERANNRDVPWSSRLCDEKNNDDTAAGVSTNAIVDDSRDIVRTAATPETSDSEINDEDEANPRLPVESAQQPKRPRITKPTSVGPRDRSADSNLREKSEPPSPKAIRGRRRALYSTPNTRKSTPQSSPSKQQTTGIPIGRNNTTPIVRATRATTLRQNTNNSACANKDTARMNVVAKILQSPNAEKRARTMAMAKRSSIPQRGTTTGLAKTTKRHSEPSGCPTNSRKDVKTDLPTVKPLERQGTFTKDEPEVENATAVVISSPSKSKIAKPARGSPIRVNPSIAGGKSKIGVRTHNSAHQQQHQPQQQQHYYQQQQQQSQPPHPKLTKCASAEKIQPTRVSIGPSASKRSSIPETSTLATRNENSNPQMETSKMPRRTVSLGQRSNSNSSIVSPSVSACQRKIPKEATSKIASLWKKVEDTKRKQSSDKKLDRRQWITAQSDVTDNGATAVTEKSPVFRLFRSSTFEGVGQESDDVVRPDEFPGSTKKFVYPGNFTRYRNSCDLTGMTSADAPCKIPMKIADDRTNFSETPMGRETVVMRKNRVAETTTTTTTIETDVTKRISRLGSFVRVDPADAENSQSRGIEIGTRSTTIGGSSRCDDDRSDVVSIVDDDDDDEVSRDLRTDIVTASTRVTIV